MYQTFAKRLFDLTLTIPALILLSPVLLLALLVRLKLGAPVIFRQQRPGLHGRPFTLYKFRTMTDARNAELMAHKTVHCIDPVYTICYNCHTLHESQILSTWPSI